MKSKDLVPCFYTGQDYRRDQPAELLPRADVRKYKALKLGKFIESGKVFVFFARLARKVVQTIWDGPAGAKTVLTFLKTNSYGDKLHYEIPRAGDRGAFARHRRKFIHVSGRIAPELRSLSQIPA